MFLDIYPSPPPEAPDGIPEFVVPATVSLQERRPRTLKHGDTFAVFDRNGDLVPGQGAAEGIYHQDTRYLSQLTLGFGGARPILLSSTLRDDNATLTCDLTNPDLYRGDALSLEHDLVHIRRSKFVFRRRLLRAARHPELRRDDAAAAARGPVRRGLRRSFRGARHAPPAARADFTRRSSAANSVALSYTGLDDRRRVTRLRFDPMPDRLEAGRAMFELELAPGGRAVICLEIHCDQETPCRQLLRGVLPRPSAVPAGRCAARLPARPRRHVERDIQRSGPPLASPISTC